VNFNRPEAADQNGQVRPLIVGMRLRGRRRRKSDHPGTWRGPGHHFQDLVELEDGLRVPGNPVRAVALRNPQIPSMTHNKFNKMKSGFLLGVSRD